MTSALEFYSGIGGMYYGLKRAQPSARVLGAFDINTTANAIYRHNFPDTTLHQNNIEALSVAFLDAQAATLWTMSPPCQPFTKKGLQLGEEDRRSDSFLSLLSKLELMGRRPTHLFLENVVGLEESSVHDLMIEKLHNLGYKTQEFILSPMQYGVPNSRPRYYLLASISPSFDTRPDISTQPPVDNSPEVAEIRDFLENSSGSFEFIDAATISKYGRGMDVVTKESKRSSCFTKSYGSYINGCGSYVCERPELVEANHLTEESLKTPEETRVRRMTPREMANLMCFPENFEQPPTTTNKQMYRTLGNSVNVSVVAALLEYLLGYCCE